MDEQKDLISVAMQIILHAGDARNLASDALVEAKQFHFDKAAELMAQAEAAITSAHKSQTEVIQGEASGNSYEYSLLFAHAQDTLMTINSELRLSRELIDVIKIVAAK